MDMYGAWVCVTHHDLAFPLGRQLYFGLPSKHIALRWKRGLQMAVDLNLPSPLGEQKLSWLCDAFRVATRGTADGRLHAGSELGQRFRRHAAALLPSACMGSSSKLAQLLGLPLFATPAERFRTYPFPYPYPHPYP